MTKSDRFKCPHCGEEWTLAEPTKYMGLPSSGVTCCRECFDARKAMIPGEAIPDKPPCKHEEGLVPRWSNGAGSRHIIGLECMECAQAFEAQGDPVVFVEVKSSVECPTCKGKGTDPRKRKRSCPATFCQGGRVPVDDPCCSCECHDKAGIIHFDECCDWSGYRRMDMPI